MAVASLFEKVKAFFSTADVIVVIKPASKPYAIKGSVSTVLLQGIDELITRPQKPLFIFQFGSSREYHLSFSKGVPQALRQRLRNIWGVHSR